MLNKEGRKYLQPRKAGPRDREKEERLSDVLK